jgi:PAS domain-containing protein
MAQAWWGGTFTIARREPSVWLGAVYVLVAVAFGYGLVGAWHMRHRDTSRRGAGRRGRRERRSSPRYSRFCRRRRPQPAVSRGRAIAIWVLLMAMVLSREYADRGERLAAGERRFRAVFDESSEFVFLTQPDGTLMQANRAALTAAAVSPATWWGSRCGTRPGGVTTASCASG